VLLRADPPLHLTYCTNIHPAEGWGANDAILRRVAPMLKARLSPSAPFGIGLRLGAREARELLEGDRLAAFRAFLDEHGLYVAILNGFPYGPFHDAPVKTNVYAPDWRTDARVEYTLNLATVLAALLPDGVDGGISTVPLSYKAWMPSGDAPWELLTRNVARVAESLVGIRRETGRLIHLDIEPEPDCLLETTEETAAFFEEWLWPTGASGLARTAGISASEATACLRDHVRVCFDCCHCAVEFEDPAAALARFRAAGIRIGRVQLSSALTLQMPEGAAEAQSIRNRLRPFADSTYLHQVVDRCGTTLARFSDLDDALSAPHPRASCERRIHFHVPLFTSEYDGLGSSQNVVRAVLDEVRRGAVTQHLEIETYTWSVLPEALKMEIGASIAREYDWVMSEWSR
jgi:sugar phosphate isomerase/epimerase